MFYVKSNDILNGEIEENVKKHRENFYLLAFLITEETHF